MIEKVLKRECLLDLAKQGKVNQITVLAVPTRELLNAYCNMPKDINSLERLLSKYKIENKANKYGDTAISFYFPEARINGMTMRAAEIVAINIRLEKYMILNENSEVEKLPNMDIDKLEDELDKIIYHLTNEVIDYYQVFILPKILNKMIGTEIYGEGITFADMLLMIPQKNQTKLAEELGITRATISDYKSNKAIPSTKVLSKLMKLYPLLPYDHYIADIKDEKQ